MNEGEQTAIEAGAAGAVAEVAKETAEAAEVAAKVAQSTADTAVDIAIAANQTAEAIVEEATDPIRDALESIMEQQRTQGEQIAYLTDRVNEWNQNSASNPTSSENSTDPTTETVTEFVNPNPEDGVGHEKPKPKRTILW